MVEFRWDNNTKSHIPICHGNPKLYDSTDRECRACSHLTSCREVVAAANYNQQVQQVQQVQQAAPFSSGPQPFFAPGQQAQAPQRPTWPPPPTQQPSYPQPWQAPQRPPVQAMQIIQPTQQATAINYVQYAQETYGRMNDPLHSMIYSCPVPPRPQMAGESFKSRMMKNVGLALAETFLAQLLLGVRQAVLPPKNGQ